MMKTLSPATGLLPRGVRTALRLCLLLGLAAHMSACSTAPKAPVAPPPTEASAALSPELMEKFDAAMRLIQDENHEKGMQLLEEVATQSRKSASPLINLAMIRMQKGDLAGAEANLKSALEREPGNPVASNELGIVYRKTGRFAEARQLYEQVLVKYPTYAIMHKNLGILCDIYLRDDGCALKGYQAYSAAFPDDKNAKIWITDLQKRTGGQGQP